MVFVGHWTWVLTLTVPLGANSDAFRRQEDYKCWKEPLLSSNWLLPCGNEAQYCQIIKIRCQKPDLFVKSPHFKMLVTYSKNFKTLCWLNKTCLSHMTSDSNVLPSLRIQATTYFTEIDVAWSLKVYKFYYLNISFLLTEKSETHKQAKNNHSVSKKNAVGK